MKVDEIFLKKCKDNLDKINTFESKILKINRMKENLDTKFLREEPVCFEIASQYVTFPHDKQKILNDSVQQKIFDLLNEIVKNICDEIEKLKEV